MEHVPLGASGLRVSRLGYGCGALSGPPRDDDAAQAMIRHARELGVTFFATTGGHHRRHTERLLGKVLSTCADDVVLATTVDAVDPTPRGPLRVRAACEASLRRLQVDVIDLCQLNLADSPVPVEDTVGAAADLVTAGKVRAVGLSTGPAGTQPPPLETIRRAHAVHPVAAVQAELSLSTPAAQSGPLQLCRELGIALIAYRPLGIGWASGARDARRLWLLARLREAAKPLGCTPAQLALAWVLARGPNVVPVPRTRRRDHLQENVAAIQLRPTTVQLEALDSVVAAASRIRYPTETFSAPPVPEHDRTP